VSPSAARIRCGRLDDIHVAGALRFAVRVPSPVFTFVGAGTGTSGAA